MTELAKRADLAPVDQTPPQMTVAQSETAAILSMIERLARDSTVDIGRVERMMTLHREIRMEKAREDYNHAMARVQSKLPQIKRDAQNKHTKSVYARLETISAAVDPIIAEAGLSLSYGTEPSALPNHYKVVCTVSLGAHERRFELDTPTDAVGSGGNANKTAIQAMGSALSYARRYLKLMIFDIALTNEDNDGNRVVDDVPPPRREPEPHSDAPAEKITPEQQAQLKKAIEFVGETVETFCKVGKIKALSDLPASQFREAMSFVQNAGRK